LTYAQHSVGGGGGGGHFSGGGHFGGGFGGGHAMGGPHFGGGGPYFGGHVMGGGARFAGAPHFAAPRAVHGGIHTVAPGVVGHPGIYGHPGTAYAPGTAYGHGGHAWYGGYWHGAYWPHVWYYPGYAWWFPVMPIGYATYWWGGMPYYYWNNVYYTWSPGYNGYVVTDPPPVATDIVPDASADQYEQAPPAQYSDQAQQPGQYPAQPPGQYSPPAGPPALSSGSGADLYLYPRNGQNDAQQQNDRYECHSWAVGQTGFDPTRSGPQSGNEATYRRAMVACLDARGYSAR
jgi:hypothetical protein